MKPLLKAILEVIGFVLCGGIASVVYAVIWHFSMILAIVIAVGILAALTYQLYKEYQDKAHTLQVVSDGRDFSKTAVGKFHKIYPELHKELSGAVPYRRFETVCKELEKGDLETRRRILAVMHLILWEEYWIKRNKNKQDKEQPFS